MRNRLLTPGPFISRRDRVAERKPFLLRVDRTLLDAMQRWANDDLRSLNAQIEFVLRRSLQQVGRSPTSQTPAEPTPDGPHNPGR